MSRVAKSVFVLSIVVVLSILPLRIAIGQSLLNGVPFVHPSFSLVEAQTETPSDVTIQFTGVTFNPEDQTYEIQLNVNSSSLVNTITISVLDVEGGMQVVKSTFTTLNNTNTFTIPTDALTTGRNYQFIVNAFGNAGNSPLTITLDSSGHPITDLTYNFTFDPSVVLPKIEIELVVQQGNNLLLNISTTNPQLIGGFDGWLVDENTNTQVLNSNFSNPPMTTAAGTVIIPMEQNRIPNGKYTVILRVLGKNQQVYSSAQYSGIVFAAIYPSIFQNIATTLKANPGITIAIIAIILMLVGFLMYNNIQTKSLTGTPVMQSRLGTKQKKKRGEPFLPIADEEPISIGHKSSIPVLIILRSLHDMRISGKEIPLNQFPFTIGRLNCMLTIHDDNISRQHAQITYSSRTRSYSIIDLKSSNGTRVDGVALVGGRPHPLDAGVVVTFGSNVEARFEI